MAAYKLSEKEQKFILENCKETPNISALAKKLSDNKYDGRSRLGQAISKFLVDRNIDYKTSKYKKRKAIDFTDEQLDFIKAKSKKGMNSLEIATLIFPNKEIKPLCFEQKQVLGIIRGLGIDSNEVFDKKYFGPKSIAKVVQKINKYVNIELDEEKLSPRLKKSTENLLKTMNSPRFINMMNSYETVDDREIFESTLIRSIWNQHDIAADEENMYLNLSADYVIIKDLERDRKRLSKLFDEAEDKDMSVKLAEMLKAKGSEYNSCHDRIEKAIVKLNGERSKRKEKQVQANESILSLIEAFQDEEERLNILKQAKVYEQELKEEADRLENVDSFKARIWGMDKDLL